MLSAAQKREFYERGYLVLRNVVPNSMAEAARKAINYSIGNVGQSGENMASHQAAQFCRDLNKSPVITGLFNNEAVVSIVEDLIGKGNLLTPIAGAQVAPRFPNVMDEDPPEFRGHLDGMGNGKNGMPKGVYRRGFTAFAVIYLGDVPEPFCGNFTVWPKSHQFFEDYFNSEGVEVLEDGTPSLDLPEGPDMITGEAGDLVLAHHQIIHTGGPNASPNIRYAAIARLRHVDCEENGNDGFTDIWREYPGVRAVVGSG